MEQRCRRCEGVDRGGGGSGGRGDNRQRNLAPNRKRERVTFDKPTWWFGSSTSWHSKAKNRDGYSKRLNKPNLGFGAIDESVTSASFLKQDLILVTEIKWAKLVSGERFAVECCFKIHSNNNHLLRTPEFFTRSSKLWCSPARKCP